MEHRGHKAPDFKEYDVLRASVGMEHRVHKAPAFKVYDGLQQPPLIIVSRPVRAELTRPDPTRPERS